MTAATLTGPTTAARSRWHAPGLDVLRFGLFAAVFCEHGIGRLAYAPAAVTRASEVGGFAVVGFFTLSAYLITRLLLLERAATGGVRLRAYFRRRALRIWPLYFVVVTAVAGLGAAARLAGVRAAHGDLGVPAALLPGLYTFTVNWVTPFVTAPYNALSHTWSVSVEEQFYLVLPLLAVLATRVRVPALLALAAVGPLARLIVVAGGLPFPAVWTFSTSHLDAILIGVAVAAGQQRGGAAWRRLTHLLGGTAGRVALGLAVAGVLAAGARLGYPAMYGAPVSALSYLVVSLVAAWAVVVAQGATAAGRPARVAGWLGRRTYGLYLFHKPVLMAFSQFGAQPRLSLAGLAAVLAITVALALASYEWLEKPFLRRRHPQDRHNVREVVVSGTP